MAINKKNAICKYALSSLNDVVSFAKFVSYAEDLPQVNELFENEESRENYQQIWFELEILNALALSEWENEGRPADWQSRWETDYKHDAYEIVTNLLKSLSG
ncbi:MULTISPECIES: hypothetical protein [Tenebrionibacter/Tenebrionicola group]|jgi:hypothetical protein|uniref:Uncharacterized protein n=2 Tax=Tenebrionibacter/Tenebrionicola group TaxID=2969848 RepID=A0A8K0V479_9ENTR|nr:MULTISPECIES: hypothetical protein [Tenebrionibacter/Tenebrionicola group]MBK4717204.1 hypothetical protein [Tenebrionibacter intestinalis]MBV5097338.1 hypothetical protein [Tenebrionicola larvae]